jgi:dynactin-4
MRLDVKYSSHSDQHAALHELFYCTACASESSDSTANPLRSLNVIDVIEDIDAFYCPFSLETFSSQEAMMYFNRSPKCFECPSCCTVLITSLDSAKEEYYFSCSYCRWNSLHLGLVADRPEALVMGALERERETSSENRFKEMVNKLREKAGSNVFSPKARHFRTPRRTFSHTSSGNTDMVQRVGNLGEPWNWEKVENALEQQSQKMALNAVVKK